jgi:large subunit ribosomal protein L1
MPNPKTGTVTMDIAKAVREAKAGKIEYRTDRGANVHIAIGKKQLRRAALIENYAALLDEIVRAKPSVAKGRYIKKITLRPRWGLGSTSTRRAPATSPKSSPTRPPIRQQRRQSQRANLFS